MPGEQESVANQLGVPVEKLVEHQIRQQANAAAAAEPLPGAVKDAFLQRQPSIVGKYSVRACCDGDIEYLSLLDHPLNDLRLSASTEPRLNTGTKEEKDAAFAEIWAAFERKYNYRGPMAWQICYLLTHSIDDVDNLFEHQGIEGIKKAARKEFSRLAPSHIMELTPACLIQYMRSWNPMLSHEPASLSDDGEIVKKNQQPAQTASG